jgi:hypothetical protein
MEMLEVVGGVIIVVLAIAFIVTLMYAGCMVCINSAREDAQRQINLKARRMADAMFKEWIENATICVEQRVVVIEDPLGEVK